MLLWSWTRVAVALALAGADSARIGRRTPWRSIEVAQLLRSRWQRSYDLQLFTPGAPAPAVIVGRTWKQGSRFRSTRGLCEKACQQLLESAQWSGVAQQSTPWLQTTRDSPGCGKAMSLTLQPGAGGSQRESCC